MEPSRQQRRGQARERARLTERLFREGLFPTAGPPAAVILVRHLMGVLGRSGDGRRASKAADAVHRVFEAHLRVHPALPRLDCKRGCAHCCSLIVTAAAPEVLQLAASIRQGRAQEAAALKARIGESRAAAGHLTIGDMVRKPVPCGLLSDDACSRYSARPLGCRGHVSQSVEACLANVADPTARIPGSRPHGEAALDCKLALFAALKAARLPHRSYELNAALERALETEDAECRWLAGEDVFQGVPMDPTRTPEIEALLDRMIADASA
ncbi:MAG: YkgJ family cysteine cluster protein [Alphaproteobacteria bacterium]|nr:YkgJ family cysteine cluster protein [Alphaproteobacteria bacterium]